MTPSAVLKQLRPKSWLKNIFVFAPLVFSLGLTDTFKLAETVLAFLAFCLISSAVYILNDIRDVEADRRHPTKRNRPIASGDLDAKTASFIGSILAVLALVIAVSINVETGAVIVLYATVNVLYSTWLKYIPIVDSFCIAAGFVLRVYAGAFASGEPVSDWLFLTIMAMSLFMAFGKRYDELRKVDFSQQRAVLRHYGSEFLLGMVFVCAGLSVVFYSLWAMDRGEHLIYSVPLVVFVVAKYLLLILDEHTNGDPTSIIFSSRTLRVAFVAYAVLILVLLYAGRAI